MKSTSLLRIKINGVIYHSLRWISPEKKPSLWIIITRVRSSEGTTDIDQIPTEVKEVGGISSHIKEAGTTSGSRMTTISSRMTTTNSRRRKQSKWEVLIITTWIRRWTRRTSAQEEECIMKWEQDRTIEDSRIIIEGHLIWWWTIHWEHRARANRITVASDTNIRTIKEDTNTILKRIWLLVSHPLPL